MGKTRILILGGTTEARQLAEALASRADLDVVLSLAGRTVEPAPQPVPVRSGVDRCMPADAEERVQAPLAVQDRPDASQRGARRIRKLRGFGGNARHGRSHDRAP